MFEPRKYVYHYTKPDVAVDHILTNMTLKMGPLSEVNDPRESKTWPFRFYSRSPDVNPKFSEEFFHRASRLVTGSTFVLCCTQDDDGLRPDAEDRHLRSGYGHSRMWSQYAQDHSGVCLVLSFDSLNDAVMDSADTDPLFSGPVQYYMTSTGPLGERHPGPFDITYLEDVLNTGIDSVLESHIAEFHQQLLFTKHLDWRDEHEYRWAIRRNGASSIFVPIRNCLRAVILGHDCGVEVESRIVEICRPEGIAVYRLYWRGWSLHLFGDLADPSFAAKDLVSLTSSFSTLIPCGGVFLQGSNQHGQTRTILVENSGAVKVLDRS